MASGYNGVTAMESRTRDVPNHQSLSPQSSALRILVVEDHEDTANTLAMLLRLYGYQVEVAADAQTAWRAAQDREPDVVLLDLGLPKVDGWWVAKQIRNQSNAKRPFLIAMTGYGRRTDLERSHEMGIDLHLVKPVEPDTLRQVLRRFQTVLTPGVEE
jgi:CheY-like chemotaxis protein